MAPTREPAPAPSAPAPGRLAWRCRRGMKELDLILESWLRRRYASATPAERDSFERLLDLPDPDLAACLLGQAPPPDPPSAALLAQLAVASR